MSCKCDIIVLVYSIAFFRSSFVLHFVYDAFPEKMEAMDQDFCFFSVSGFWPSCVYIVLLSFSLRSSLVSSEYTQYV